MIFFNRISSQLYDDVFRYSYLNWRYCTRKDIEGSLIKLIANSCKDSHRFTIIETDNTDTVQVNGFSDFLYKTIGANNVGRKQEEPSSLVYSTHPNGTVTVSIYPHMSDIAKIDPPYFIIDYLDSSYELAGIKGEKLIANHFYKFVRLSLISHARYRPSRASQRFIAELTKKHKKYRNIHKSLEESTKLEHETNLALVVALIVALIGSVFFPLLKEFGQQTTMVAKQIASSCATAPIPTECLSTRWYSLQYHVGQVLSVEHLLIITCLLISLTALGAKRFLEK